MKAGKFYLILFLIIFCNFTHGQWISPGNGQNYTLSTLSIAAPETVETQSEGVFLIAHNVTISAADTLTIENTAVSLLVNPGVTIKINGTLRTASRDDFFTIDKNGLSGDDFYITFDSASCNLLKNVNISHCSRILLINSNVDFIDCEFQHFSNHVISYMNCSPRIEYSYFHDNDGCAIQSAINTKGSPKILYNRLENNVLANTNNPQINIGPGAEDTIKIIGNYIVGGNSTMSGGIGISNLYDLDITKVIVKDNGIFYNRYGYAQNGYRISSEIINNRIVENNLEVNPMNGGSGISIFGYDTTCAAKIRNNLIKGNLWGVTAIYCNSIDMGTEDDFGYNVLYENGNNGVDYELFNNSNSDITAVGNYWGTVTAEETEEVIYHKNDSTIYGFVNYLPINVIEPEIVWFYFSRDENPTINFDAFGVFSENEDTIYVHVERNGVSELRPFIYAPFGNTIFPPESEYFSFEEPITYTAYTPHGSSRSYVVVVDFTTDIANFIPEDVKLYPNPVADNSLTISNSSNNTYKWKLFSSDGKIVKTGFLETGDNHIFTHGLSKGVYILKFENGREFFTKKLIVK